MVRSVVSKVMWLGRATVFLVGLAVILALVVGVASTAFGANGANFILGSLNNSATAITKLTGTVGGSPALRVSNPSTATGSTALDLQVATGKAPMKVNRTTKVANLNADQLDGKDSSAFGINTAHTFSFSDECDTPNTFNECAPLAVTVPTGKTYMVSVWSSFTARGGASNQDVLFCSAKKDPGQTTPSCITPDGADSLVTIEANQYGAAAASAESVPLSGGTYVFSTAINPQAQFVPDNGGKVITKVLVRDASGATVSSASVSEQGAALRER